MSSSGNEEKPTYFANGDFEKTVQDIISSPRRGKPYLTSSQESLFEITEKQREYYTRCFKHMLKITQDLVTSDLGSQALYGSDPRLIEFFTKSRLDKATLSRIWKLSDVNEDGWLNIEEFSMAMHLIVLRVKGEVPVPTQLPVHLRPSFTPPRTTPLASDSTISPGTTYVPQQKDLTNIPSTQMNASTSWASNGSTSVNGKLEDRVSLATFSDVPPLLVDGRPTAMKAAAPAPHVGLLSLKSPLGPPPEPPPRPYPRGHGRSASLDFKAMVVNGYATNDRRDSDTGTIIAKVMESRPKSGFAVVPPPIPQRSLSPPILPVQSAASKVTVSKSSVETQTDETLMTDEALAELVLKKVGREMDDLLCREAESASNGSSGFDRWLMRCEGLKRQNVELEQERARLAQVRIQLELRLQELEEKSKGNTNKPTTL